MRNTTRIVLYFILSISCISAIAQEVENKKLRPIKHTHVVGFDANTMLSQVVPFNGFSPSSSTFPAIVVRRLWNGKGYRSTAGFKMDENSFEFINLHFSLGYTSRKELSPKIDWIKGIDAILSGNQNSEFFGLGAYWGVEYHLNDVVSISTESTITTNFFEFGQLSITPPVHLQCHFRLK